MSDETSSKPTNPKDQIGSLKLPIHLWPPTATAQGCIGFLNGLLKYGRSNWRPGGVKCSIYIAAALRHIYAWYEGEEVDPDDGVPHLSAALACLAIIVDARAAGVLDDDRQYPGGYHKLVAELTGHVARLKELHAAKSPKHWTLQDAPEKLQPVATTIFADSRPFIEVVVGVFIQEDGAVFLQQRRHDDENFPGRWECPGGGVQPGESDIEALKREIKEELDVDATICERLWTGRNDYMGRWHEFRFYRAMMTGGCHRNADGQPHMGWFKDDQVRAMALTPANMLAWPSILDAIQKNRSKP